ncbi:protein phosphatase methylesterase 1 [Diplogelasinospora grovesii]|uniref:Protein phosphatase methylesterase 1 n=1 Tax=Diplogelasinospora grovesii TaxID=303347 RepID=A0AAN6N6H0_9PEZI|nr:protein phosphatase methylesterase 1 [Diplogelasinospora grovesii]
MSALQKKWAKSAVLLQQQQQHDPTAMANLHTLSEEDPFSTQSQSDVDWFMVRGEEEGEGEGEGAASPVDDDSSSASSMSSTGTIIPSPSRSLFARPQGIRARSTLEQIPWTTYFERELFLPSQGGKGGVTHHAYLTFPVGGGGSKRGPLFVMHHGAGSSGLSFAVLSSEIRKRLPNAGILSLDARGHGSTTTTTTGGQGEEGVDLSLDTLATDLYDVIKLTQATMRWEQELPPIILVGHSLGGAVVTHLAKSGRLGGALLGYAVLDVVEGSAMDALQSMHTYLSTRPSGFRSVKDAIEWHIRSRTIRNSVSARTSVPGLLVDTTEEQVQMGRDDKRPWKWRTNLAATQPFWEGWFVGLSKKFLEAKGAKMLLLAGTDRLDTELTIGQMQGKYALQVFPEAGHFIHEDLPEKTAIALVDFYRRNDRSQLVLPPKVSELLAQGKRV